MPTDDRRANARRKAWGRGPMILRFEPLEGRQVLSALGVSAATASGTSTTTAQVAPASRGVQLVATSFDTLHNLDWGDPFRAVGSIQNWGDTATTKPFDVDVYASTTAAIDANSVYVGTVTIPAGLQPGDVAKFDQTLHAPATPIPGLGTATAYDLDLKVDPAGAVTTASAAASAARQGFGSSLVTITPHVSADLVGDGFGLSKTTAKWGDTINVTATVKNQAQGNAPATRARVVLTAAGMADVTVGSLDVPALPAWQSAVVTGTVTLPTALPASLAGATGLKLVLLTDADYTTRPILSTNAMRGEGIDSAAITVAAPQGTATSTVAKPRADLSVSSIQTPASITWGTTAQVTAFIENNGKADAAEFRARFLIVDNNHPGNAPLAIGDAVVPGLKAGYSQLVQQTIDLQGKLPDGLNAASIAPRIVVLVDPENRVDETDETNNSLMSSSPISLKLITRDGQSTAVPTTTTTTKPTTTTPAPTTTKPTTTTTTTTSTTSTTKPAPTPTPAPRVKRIVVHKPHAHPAHAPHALRIHVPKTAKTPKTT